MAGSYRHIVTSDGEFRGVELIENLGDAYEALEECYQMIQWLSRGERTLIARAWLEGYVMSKKKRYGRRMSAEERDRWLTGFWEK